MRPDGGEGLSEKKGQPSLAQLALAFLLFTFYSYSFFSFSSLSLFLSVLQLQRA